MCSLTLEYVLLSFIQTSDCWLEGRLARGELDPNHLTTAWLIDVQLLSYGHAFVGQV